jgi:hypothetical protein
MRKSFVFTAAAVASLAPWCQAGTSGDINPQEVIQRFANKETEFLKAREVYTYRQTVKLYELDLDGNPTDGRYEMVEDVIFDRDGKRTEHVVKAPPNTLQHLLLTPEDENDLRNIQPFVLNSENIAKYQIDYLGKQQVDEIPCYAFSVKPKQLVKGERFFEGQIWVDDRDLQIVKTYGRGVGFRKKGDDNQFPKFETYRQQIDGKYWFPTFTIANDTLQFRDGPQRVKMVVRYDDYKKFKSDVNIQYGDEVTTGEKPDTQPKKQN